MRRRCGGGRGGHRWPRRKGRVAGLARLGSGPRHGRSRVEVGAGKGEVGARTKRSRLRSRWRCSWPMRRGITPAGWGAGGIKGLLGESVFGNG